MDRKDQNKLLEADFSIIRKGDYPTPHIKARTIRDWKTIGKYKTKAERDRAFAGLLKDNNTISD